MLKSILPFLTISVLFAAWTWVTRIGQSNYSDDRFVLASPWLWTLLRSSARMMFPWGLVSVVCLFFTGTRRDWRLAAGAGAVMALGILPYSFLTYMPQIASRHAYLGSAGLALLAGLAGARLATRHKLVFAVVALAALVINVEIIWVKKTAQFRERAEPEVILRDIAADAGGGGAIVIRCIPFSERVAQAVLATSGARAGFVPYLRYDDHCLQVDYLNKAGAEVHVDRRIRNARHGAFY